MSEMTARYRIYVPEEEAAALATTMTVEESYPAFQIVTASEETISDIQQRYPVEKLRAASPPPLMPHVAGLSDEMVARQRGPYTMVVRFKATASKGWEQTIEAAECRPYTTIGSSSVVVACPNLRTLEKLRSQPSVEQVTPYIPQIQLSPEFFEGLALGEDEAAMEATIERLRQMDQAESPAASLVVPGILMASFFSRADQQLAMRNLPRQGVRHITETGPLDMVIDLTLHTAPEDALFAIVERRGLRSLEEKTIDVVFNNIARQIIADRVLAALPTGLGLTGQGEIVAVADTGLDTGDPATIHLDLRERIRHIKSYPFSSAWKPLLLNPTADNGAADNFSGHGTHVAGSILGNGRRALMLELDEEILGTAPAAALVFQSIAQHADWNLVGRFFWRRANLAPPAYGLFAIPDNLQDLFLDAYQQNARIHSNSWGGGAYGVYDLNSQNLDQFVWDHKDFLVVVAAGNEAEKTIPPRQVTSVTSPGTAKNCLTVGACENERNGALIDMIANFSGRGPCQTGRRKPDLVAPGTYILSTRSSQIQEFGWGKFEQAPADYMFLGGTSMATPLVAGCAALVRQYLRQAGWDNPSAALLKATLIHAAEYHPFNGAHPEARPFADNEQGWGRLALQAVLHPSPPVRVEFMDVQPGLQTGEHQQIRLQIADSSIPLRLTLVYTDFPGEDLINNLHLFARAPGGQFFVGNDFNSTGVPDSTNNVEGILVENPMVGEWRIQVVAGNVAVGPQDFALVISGGGIGVL